jgi:hypothetical protein
MAELFWLSAWMIVGLSAASCTAFGKACVGGRFRTRMAPHDGIQPVQPLEPARVVARAIRGPC